jgi:predicted nucleic acid-binding protein
MDILLDASVIMAIILNESTRRNVIRITENAMLLSPEVISFEIGNALTNLYKKQKITEEELEGAYKNYELIPIRIIRIDIKKALKIACKYNIFAYDAYYLEAAHRLKLPLCSFDEKMKSVGSQLKIHILETVQKEED